MRLGNRVLASGLALAVLSAVTLAGPARADTTAPPATPAAVTPVDGPADGLLVRFKDDASAHAVEHAVTAAGGTVEDVAGATGFVRVSTGSKPPSAVESS